MKHRLAPLLEGMEMGKSEHDWLEQRLESMTAKEELLFRGAMQIESPRDIQTTIQILQGLDHYQLLYGAEDDVLLGRFVMEHIHTPTHAARGYERITTLLHSGLHIQYMKSSNRQQYLKRKGNRKDRKYHCLPKKGNLYRKVFDYWWELY